MLSKNKRYKVDLEEGTNTPRSTRYYRQKKDENNEDEYSSDDRQEFHKLLNRKRISDIEQHSNTGILKSKLMSTSSSSYSHDREDAEAGFTNENHDRHFTLQHSSANNDYYSDTEHYGTENDEEEISTNEEFKESLLYDSETEETDIMHDYLDDDFYLEDDFWSAVEQENYSELQNNLMNDDFNKTISSKLIVSKSEMLYAITKYCDHYRLPLIAMEDLCSMMNSFLTSPVLPNTRYRLDKLLRNRNCMEFHAVCPVCEIYLRQFDPKEHNIYCNMCTNNISVKGNNTNFFVILNIKDKVKHLLQNNAAYYGDVINNMNQETSSFNDIYSGLMYTEFFKSLSYEQQNSYVSCTFNSDGSPVFKSSIYSIWPIQIFLNELPPNVRLKETITCALWFGKNKPKMNIFLKSFVEHINALNVEGIPCLINKSLRKIKIHPICCCVDTIARAPMQGIIQFNGRYGCNWCHHPGVPVKSNKKKVIKYPLLNEIPSKRTTENILEHIKTKSTNGKPVFGVRERSALIDLNYFDIVDGFVPDSMHCIFLGVCRQFSHYWFDECRKPYSLNRKVELIDDILKSLRVPTQLARLPRPLKERKYWKSREWENWILYYSLPILRTMCGFEIYSKHWELLVEASYILMNECISKDNLMHADTCLKKFVSLTEKLYSKAAMTYNIHQLLHLSQSVANWGPLWGHNGYPFESGNGQILRTVQAAKGVLHQICRSIEFKNSSAILEQHIVENYSESPVIDFSSYLRNRYTDKSIKINENRYFGQCLPVNKKWLKFLKLSKSDSKSYNRMLKKDCLFSSCNVRMLRSKNCFAITRHGMYIKIIHFIIDEKNCEEYTICNVVETQNIFNTCTNIKQIIRIHDCETFILTNDIASVVVCINVEQNSYVSAVPNKLHY